MPVDLEFTDFRPATVRGLYDYDIDEICSRTQPLGSLSGAAKDRRAQGPHQAIAKDRARIGGPTGFSAIIKSRKALGASYAALSLAFEQTDRGPALIYRDEGERPLDELAAKGALDIESALNTAASIAEAVAALHKERLVHCNLNPTTVWFNDQSSLALISDFGCARRLSEEGGRERHIAMS